MKNNVLKSLKEKKRFIKLYITVLVGALSLYVGAELYIASATLNTVGPATAAAATATAAAAGEGEKSAKFSDGRVPTKEAIEAVEVAICDAERKVRRAQNELDVFEGRRVVLEKKKDELKKRSQECQKLLNEGTPIEEAIKILDEFSIEIALQIQKVNQEIVRARPSTTGVRKEKMRLSLLAKNRDLIEEQKKKLSLLKMDREIWDEANREFEYQQKKQAESIKNAIQEVQKLHKKLDEMKAARKAAEEEALRKAEEAVVKAEREEEEARRVEHEVEVKYEIARKKAEEVRIRKEAAEKKVAEVEGEYCMYCYNDGEIMQYVHNCRHEQCNCRYFLHKECFEEWQNESHMCMICRHACDSEDFTVRSIKDIVEEAQGKTKQIEKEEAAGKAAEEELREAVKKAKCKVAEACDAKRRAIYNVETCRKIMEEGFNK